MSGGWLFTLLQPREFHSKLVKVFQEVRRVLSSDGTAES